MKKVLLLLLLLTVPAASVLAVDGAQVDIRVFQNDPASGENVLLMADTTYLVQGLAAAGFFLTFSLDLLLVDCDSSHAELQAHVVTLADIPRTYARQYRVEYGLPARLEDIEGKDSTQYLLQVTPLVRFDVDTSGCGFSERVQGTFASDPSAYMDIYYVRNSMADFYWNTVRGYMQEQYEKFFAVNRFTLPGKYIVHLCPCAIPSVIWDPRFGTMVDPTRSAAYAIFAPELNTADPFIINHAALLRNYGYAPLFLSEGFAGYVSFARWEMKQLLKQGKSVPLRDLMNTHTYWSADPETADRTAASFVGYLIDEFSLDNFRDVYRAAHDLNLAAVIESEYGKSIEELESDWRHYLDTLTFRPEQIVFFSEQAETMMNYRTSLDYSRALMDYCRNSTDTLTVWRRIVRGNFLTGDYYGAAEYQQMVVEHDSATARDWMALGAYQMMNGEYDKASASLTNARQLDTTDAMVRFNLALNYFYGKDPVEALGLLRDNITRAERIPTQIESRVMAATLLYSSGTDSDAELAAEYCKEAMSMIDQAMQTESPTAALYLWSGIAALGLEDTGRALEHLSTALMLETRPFYRGMINLWLGKLTDAIGSHSDARILYGRVLALPSAHYHQQEARALLEKPAQ
jgi:tetratricopeptide (TPR) repeat protein